MPLNWLSKLLNPSSDHPEFWKAYLASFDGTLARRTPIEEACFVVFDTETTGLDAKKDRILSIGAVKVRNWQVDLSARLECYVQQSYTPEGGAIAVHGILPGTNTSHALDEIEAVRRFVGYCHNSVLVGHHVAFDIAMVNQVLRGMIGQKLANKKLDTAALAARVSEKKDYEQPGTYGLDTLCRKYKIPMSDRHTAAGDAFITAVLLMKLLARLRKRGVKTVGELLRGPGM
ncbi:MAG: 3'-5' exonuclease [Phaeodactylibacter sp.]|nr:3'-5' exonuclease [Phaeodactylibacter sp.]MCB9291792.1 3'-5' exonuclease [Lewinellaceae bacterium]